MENSIKSSLEVRASSHCSFRLMEIRDSERTFHFPCASWGKEIEFQSDLLYPLLRFRCLSNYSRIAHSLDAERYEGGSVPGQDVPHAFRMSDSRTTVHPSSPQSLYHPRAPVPDTWSSIPLSESVNQGSTRLAEWSHHDCWSGPAAHLYKRLQPWIPATSVHCYTFLKVPAVASTFGFPDVVACCQRNLLFWKFPN